MSLLDQPLGEPARDIPGITAVFHKYRIENNILFDRVDGQFGGINNG